jgi:hypothetical protein
MVVGDGRPNPGRPRGADHSQTTANVSLNSYGGGAGTIQVSGANFPASSTALLSFVAPKDTKFPLGNGEPSPYNTPVQAPVGTAGTFAQTLNVPFINAGTYQVRATDGSTTAFAHYFVQKGSSGATTFTLSSHSVVSGSCITVSGAHYYPGDVENVYIGKPGTLYSGGAFDDSFTKGNFHDQSICTTHLKKGVAVDDLPGVYELMVVGDTYGIGVATLTITPLST